MAKVINSHWLGDWEACYQCAVTDLFHLIRCANRSWCPSSSFIPLLHGVLACFMRLPLNCNVFSRRLSSSALSNLSWQPSPSSCRPLANTMMGILSEQHFILYISLHTHDMPTGLFFCVCAHEMHILLSSHYSCWLFWIKMLYFKHKAQGLSFPVSSKLLYRLHFVTVVPLSS